MLKITKYLKMETPKILIADDEPLNLMLYSEIFKTSDYVIITASDGKEALQLIYEHKPHLVVLDWNMPRMDGFEVLKTIKADMATVHIPVIMITGIMTAPENLMQALDAGAVDFLRKPFDRIELKSRVKSMLLLSNTMNELSEKYRTIEQNNRFINTLIESLPNPLVYYDLDGIVLGCNSKFCQLARKGKDEISGRLVYSILCGEKSNEMSMNDKLLLETGNSNTFECTIGETPRNFIVCKNLFYDSNGAPAGILCVMTDITELNETHKELIEIKMRELTSNALRMVQMSESNNQMITELERLEPFVDLSGKRIIRSMINQFKVNNDNNLWSEFEMRFSNINESFYKNLVEKYPDLTPNEKKLWALLRLNLSSKDIASITSQNPQSVDVARYRLRKKLNLSSEENLVDFLMNV